MNENKIKLLAITFAALMLAGGLVFLVPADESDADSVVYNLYGCGIGTSGQQGSGDTTDVTTFIQRASNVASVVATNYTTWYITTTGDLYGCGDNDYGQQGSGDTTDVTTFTQRASNVASVVCSRTTTWYITTSGDLYGCGRNDHGQQGSGDTTDVTTFTLIASNISSVVCSEETTWYITTSGDLYGSGGNAKGQQGSGGTTNVTTFTKRASDVSSVKCSDETTWYLKTSGDLYGCGRNDTCTQGSGGTTDVTTFTKRASDVSSFSCSQFSTWYITTSGDLYGCGYGYYGAQGSGDTTDVTTFTQRASNVSFVDGGNYSTWYITTSGDLYGCGAGNLGQQGSGDTTNVTTFTQRASNVSSVYCSQKGSTVWYITTSGDLYGCGAGNLGQQGSGDTTNVTTFTQRASNVISVVGNNSTWYTQPGVYSATIESNNTSYGTVSVASITGIEPGTEVTISQDGLTLTIGNFGSSVATPTTSDAQYTYAFSGWYVDNVAMQTGDTIDEDVTIEARFTQTTNQYTVSFSAGSGGTVSPASVTVDYGTSISASDNVVTVGSTPVTATPDTSTAQYTYTFDSWTNASGTVTEDRTITANFTTTLNSYTVTWSINGVETAESYGYGELPAHEDPAIEGYTFEGWDPEISTVTGNITYTAILDPIEYTVTFDAQGGTVDPASAVGSIDDPIALPTPTKQFYSFDGWYDAATEGTLVSSPYTPTADITLYAYWSEVTYTITFDANGGTVDTATLTGSPITAVTLPRALQSGFYFAGWYTAASEGELVALAGALMYPTEDVTYYAQYSDSKVYFNGVSFSNNGGYGAPGPLSHTSASKGSYDFTIPETVPVLDGKTFRGWAKSTTESAKYQPGDTISVAADAQVTLYAIWDDQKNTNETLLSLIPLLIVIATVMLAATAAFKFRDGDYMGIIYLVIGIAVIIMLLTMFVIPVINEV